MAEKGGSHLENIIAHDKFFLLATMNPGGDYGKKELSLALRNRFTEIWVPSVNDVDDLKSIALKRQVCLNKYLTIFMGFLTLIFLQNIKPRTFLDYQYHTKFLGGILISIFYDIFICYSCRSSQNYWIMTNENAPIFFSFSM